ncbi:MAG TPA: nucleoside-diphosphate sugar epimerase, partial [Stenotrophomonas sp.]|nr:nucleoside-diphosphate sugar epimerase [Stenotrophomonas sp.]
RAQARMLHFQRALRERGRLLDGLHALEAGPQQAIEPLRETPRIAAEVKARLGL